jgi:hypothetical protein
MHALPIVIINDGTLTCKVCNTVCVCACTCSIFDAHITIDDVAVLLVVVLCCTVVASYIFIPFFMCERLRLNAFILILMERLQTLF